MRALLIAACVVFPVLSTAAECTRYEAYAAETVTDYLDSWDTVRQFYRRFGHCLDGGIAEGANHRMQRLWVDRWDEIPRMVALMRADAGFESFVLRALRTEAFPQDAFGEVVRNATTRCQRAARAFCALVKEEARRR